MLELITVALATFTCVVALRALLPFTISPKIMPFAVAAAAYGILKLPASWHLYIQAAAAAGIVALVYRLAIVSEPEPWSVWDAWDRTAGFVARHRKPKKSQARRGAIGNRLPPL